VAASLGGWRRAPRLALVVAPAGERDGREQRERGRVARISHEDAVDLGPGAVEPTRGEQRGHDVLEQQLLLDGVVPPELPRPIQARERLCRTVRLQEGVAEVQVDPRLRGGLAGRVRPEREVRRPHGAPARGRSRGGEERRRRERSARERGAPRGEPAEAGGHRCGDAEERAQRREVDAVLRQHVPERDDARRGREHEQEEERAEVSGARRRSPVAGRGRAPREQDRSRPDRGEEGHPGEDGGLRQPVARREVPVGALVHGDRESRR